MSSKPLKTMEICDWYSSGDGVTLSKDSVSSGSYTGNLGIRKKTGITSARITKLKAERPKETGYNHTEPENS